ncbi:MAG: histidine phosphatase family protein [Paracoccaceae bacterium]
MRAYPELYVLRHGQTEWNAEGRHQGRLDSALTEKGRAQARLLGEILRWAGLAGFSAHCSPQGRAMATAAIALEGTGLSPSYDDRLCEVHFGAWQGLTAADIAARWPDLAPERHDPFDWHFMSPGGERYEDLRDRASSFLQGLTGPAVIVTHGILSRVLRGLWLGLDHEGAREIEGGQGVVFHLKDGWQTCLRDVPAKG